MLQRNNAGERTACLGPLQSQITVANPGGIFSSPMLETRRPDATVPQTKWRAPNRPSSATNAAQLQSHLHTGTPERWSAVVESELAAQHDRTRPSTSAGLTRLSEPRRLRRRGQQCRQLIDNALRQPRAVQPAGVTQGIPTNEVCDRWTTGLRRRSRQRHIHQELAALTRRQCGQPVWRGPTKRAARHGSAGFSAPAIGTLRPPRRNEICDGIDNNCNGAMRRGFRRSRANIRGTPPPHRLRPDAFCSKSQCRRGTLAVRLALQRRVGPRQEICGRQSTTTATVWSTTTCRVVGNACGQRGRAVPQRAQRLVWAGHSCARVPAAASPEVCNGSRDGTGRHSRWTRRLGEHRRPRRVEGRRPVEPRCAAPEPAVVSARECHLHTRGHAEHACATGSLVCDGTNRWKASAARSRGRGLRRLETIATKRHRRGLKGPTVGVQCGPSEGECEPADNI